MNILVIILCVITVILLCYIILEKLELKRLKSELDFIMSKDTNRLLHTEFNSRELRNFVVEVNRYLTEIQRRNTEIEHKNNSFMVMMRNISHDLRTPLTSAAGYIELILKSDLTEEEKTKEIRIVEARLRRLTELINSFFEFSKILTNNRDIELEKFNIVGILEECIGNFYEDYKKEDREVEFNVESSKIFVDANRAMLVRIFENLISNALKYGIGNLKIDINKDKSATKNINKKVGKYGNKNKSEFVDFVRIKFTNKIADNELNIDRIFDDFYTTDISRTKGSTGLGLAIAKEFTELLGGTINAEAVNDELIMEICFITVSD